MAIVDAVGFSVDEKRDFSRRARCFARNASFPHGRMRHETKRRGKKRHAGFKRRAISAAGARGGSRVQFPGVSISSMRLAAHFMQPRSLKVHHCVA